jgi:small subunit ribosomal protein S20
MAHTRQAKKRIRQNTTRSTINRDRVSRLRTYIRRVEEAIESGDKTRAEQALREAEPEIMRGAAKSVLHRRTASRRVSRLARQVGALSAS